MPTKQIVSAKMPPAAADAIRAMAAAEDRTTSAIVRRLLLDSLTREQAGPKTPVERGA